MKRWWLGLIGRRLNPITLRLAREGKSHGPMKFWIMRHVGRKSGKTYETPIMLAPVPEGFVAELTYGDRVQWYQNIVAAGRCTVIRGGVETEIVSIEPYPTDAGRRAFGRFERVVLTILRRKEFRLLRAAPPTDAAEL